RRPTLTLLWSLGIRPGPAFQLLKIGVIHLEGDHKRFLRKGHGRTFKLKFGSGFHRAWKRFFELKSHVRYVRFLEPQDQGLGLVWRIHGNELSLEFLEPFLLTRFARQQRALHGFEVGVAFLLQRLPDD